MIKKYIKILLTINMVMIGFSSFPALANQGFAAIAKMNHEELILLKKVNTIQRGMSYEQVVTILGKPDREAAGIRPTW
jgi:outer membrane protein assembly factor BamE (lipoprotein component of BamABCDE complex)